MAKETDILLFLLEKNKASWSDLERQFVKGPKDMHIARQTLVNYLRRLLKQRKIAKIVDEETFKPVYIITDLGKKDLVDKVKKLTAEIGKLRSALKREIRTQRSLKKDLKEVFRLIELGEKKEQKTKLAYIEAILLLGDKLDEIVEKYPDAMTEHESAELGKKLSMLIATGKPSQEFLKQLKKSKVISTR